MIAFPDNLPMLEHRDGYVTAFRRDWLRDSLVRAARKAGYPKWWLADHLAESVTRYLATQVHEPVVTSKRLGEAVRDVLTSIGYGEVADHFEPCPPPASICLQELAGRAGNGFEILFFDLLGRRLEEVLRSGAPSIHVSGLRACAKRLSAAKNWRKDCRRLSDEIVGFVRERLGRASAETLLTLR